MGQEEISEPLVSRMGKGEKSIFESVSWIEKEKLRKLKVLGEIFSYPVALPMAIPTATNSIS